MTQRVKLRCPNCGSDAVTCDAVAEWDVTNQEWRLRSTYDDMACDDCESEFKEADEEEITDGSGDPCG